VPADPSLTVGDSQSLSLWVKPSGAGMLLTHAAGTDAAYDLALTPTNAIEYKQGPWWFGTFTSNARLAVNRWTHVVLVFDRADNSITLYLDGVAQRWTAAGAPASAPGETRLGQDSTGGRGFIGLLDEVRIYNRALSAAEVGALYGGGAPAP
jgi:hypothetical protein